MRAGRAEGVSRTGALYCPSERGRNERLKQSPARLPRVEFAQEVAKLRQEPPAGEVKSRRPVDLILTSGTPAAPAAKTATSTIPIVMGSVGDAVNTGIVSSLARPGGNITGFSALTSELEGKRLELLKVLIPQLSRVGMLANAANPLLDVSLKSLRSAADVLGVSLDIFETRRTDKIDGACSSSSKPVPKPSWSPPTVVASARSLRPWRKAISRRSTRSGNIPLSVAFSRTART